ncbi:MAG TPA: hypothetical protein VGE72_06900 [Azospirillum sp.]
MQPGFHGVVQDAEDRHGFRIAHAVDDHMARRVDRPFGRARPSLAVDEMKGTETVTEIASRLAAGPDRIFSQVAQRRFDERVVSPMSHVTE